MSLESDLQTVLGSFTEVSGQLQLSRAAAPGQRRLWNESEVEREEKPHDGKRPGEFAPKEKPKTPAGQSLLFDSGVKDQPVAKPAPQPSMLEKIADEQKKSKIIPVEGQKELFSAMPAFGTVIPSDQAKELVGQLRDGDESSKNGGRWTVRDETGPLVMSSLPTNFFDQFPDEDDGNVTNFIRSSTNPERVARYVANDPKKPIYVVVNRNQRPILSDGGHRLMAAIDRGDTHIPALLPQSLHEQIHGTEFSRQLDNLTPVEFSVAAPPRKRRVIDDKRTREDVEEDEKVFGKKKRIPTDGDKPETGWTKVGGSTVHVDDDGVIDKGCPGLKGEAVEDLIDESDESRERREARQAYARAAGITGDQITAQQAKSMGSEAHVEGMKQAKEVAESDPRPTIGTSDVLRGVDDQTGEQAGNGHELLQSNNREHPESNEQFEGAGMPSPMKFAPDEDEGTRPQWMGPKLSEMVPIPPRPKFLRDREPLNHDEAATYQPQIDKLESDIAKWRDARDAMKKGRDISEFGLTPDQKTPEYADAQIKALQGPLGKLKRQLSDYRMRSTPNQNPATQTWTSMDSAAEGASAKFGIPIHHIVEAMPDAYLFRLAQSIEHESLKKAARQKLQMHAGDLARIENQHSDWSDVPRFDEASREFASENPGAGLDPYAHDTPDKVWSLVREGVTAMPAKDSPEIAELAAQMISGDYNRKPLEFKSEEDEHGDDFSDDWGHEEHGDTSFDPNSFSRSILDVGPVEMSRESELDTIAERMGVDADSLRAAIAAMPGPKSESLIWIRKLMHDPSRGVLRDRNGHVVGFLTRNGQKIQLRDSRGRQSGTVTGSSFRDSKGHVTGTLQEFSQQLQEIEPVEFGQLAFEWDEDEHPRDEAGRFKDKLHHQIKEYLSDGSHRHLRDIHDHTGHKDYDALDPLANKANSALKELRDSGQISGTSPSIGEPHFYMTEEQIAAHKNPESDSKVTKRKEESDESDTESDDSSGNATKRQEDTDVGKLGSHGFKIEKVDDTRQYEEIDDDKWEPIAGSGQDHACDRCGKNHVIHYHVKCRATGKDLNVGSECAGATGIDDKSKHKTFQSAASTVKKLESMRDGIKEKLDKIPELQAKVSEMEFPEWVVQPSSLFKKKQGEQPRFELTLGDLKQQLPDAYHGWTQYSQHVAAKALSDAKSYLRREWESNKLGELIADAGMYDPAKHGRSYGAYLPRKLKDDLESVENRLKKAKKKLESLMEPEEFSRLMDIGPVEFGRKPAPGQKGFDFDAPASEPIADKAAENEPTKQSSLFADIPAEHLDEAKKLSELHGGREVKKTKTGWQVRSPKGGKVSEVNGTYYPGGQFMPIHGLSKPLPKPPRQEKPALPFTPPKPNEDGRGREPRSPMSAEQIAELKSRRENQEKWNSLRSTKLGEMLHLGERPHAIKHSIPFKDWYEFAESVTNERLEQIAAEAKELAADQTLLHEGLAKDSPQRKDYLENAEFYQDDDSQFMTKKHQKLRPASVKALFWIRWALNATDTSRGKKLDGAMDQSEIAQKLARIVSGESQFSRDLEICLQEFARHEFSSTQFNIRDAGYPRSQGSPLDALVKLAKSIPTEELHEGERSSRDDMHITVKYGLHTDNADEVAKIVRGFGPVTVKLGKTSIFPANEKKSYDVVKVAVTGSDIHRLNKLISASTECTDTWPDFKPHLTIAYVMPGFGKKYAGLDTFEGMELTFDSLQFSNKDREKTEIPLVDKTEEFSRLPILTEEEFEFARRPYKPGEGQGEFPFQDRPDQIDSQQGEEPVQSSNMHSFRWEGNDTTGSLLVRFKAKNGGAGPLYRVSVPKSYYEDLKKTAETNGSCGGWYWQKIRVKGSVAGHQHPVSLVGTGPTGYVPRAAGLRRGYTGEHFNERTLNGVKSTLPPAPVRKGPAKRIPGYDPSKLKLPGEPQGQPSQPQVATQSQQTSSSPSPAPAPTQAPTTPQTPSQSPQTPPNTPPNTTKGLIDRVLDFFKRKRKKPGDDPKQFSREEWDAVSVVLAGLPCSTSFSQSIALGRYP